MVGASEILFWLCVLLTMLMQPLFLLRVWACFRDAGGPQVVREGAWRMLRCGRRRPVAASAGELASSEVDELVDRLMDVRRVDLARLTLGLMWAALCPFGWVRIAEVVMDRSTQGMDELLLRRIAWLLALVLLTAAAKFPRTFVTARSLPLWLFGITAAACLLTAGGSMAGAADQLETELVTLPSQMTVGITMGLVCLKFRWLVFSSFCVSVRLYVNTARMESPCGATSIKTDAFASEALYLWAWQMAAFYAAERFLAFSVKHEVDAALGNCQRSAVSALLDLVCDAVVDLDSDLVLKEHVNRLASLLMCRAGKSLRGTRFAEYIAPGDEDQRRFHEAVVGPAVIVCDGEPASTLPNMASVRLRDVAGNVFSAALYHLPYFSINGRLHHLIGLQEASDDVEPPFKPLPAAMLNPPVEQAHGEGSTIGALSPELETHRGGFGGIDSDHSSPSNSHGHGNDSEGAAAWSGALVVKAKERLPIVALDASVQGRLDIHRGGFLADALGAGGDDLEYRILETAGRVQRGEILPQVEDFAEWELGHAGGARRGVRCSVSVDYKDPSGPGGLDLIKILLAVAPLERDAWRARAGPLRVGSEQRRTVVPL